MPRAHIVKQINIARSPRVIQLEGIFDVPPSERIAQEWNVNLPLEEKGWNVGLIVGPSGSGKSTIARELFVLWKRGVGNRTRRGCTCGEKAQTARLDGRRLVQHWLIRYRRAKRIVSQFPICYPRCAE